GAGSGPGRHLPTGYVRAVPGGLRPLFHRRLRQPDLSNSGWLPRRELGLHSGAVELLRGRFRKSRVAAKVFKFSGLPGVYVASDSAATLTTVSVGLKGILNLRMRYSFDNGERRECRLETRIATLHQKRGEILSVILRG